MIKDEVESFQKEKEIKKCEEIIEQRRAQSAYLSGKQAMESSIQLFKLDMRPVLGRLQRPTTQGGTFIFKK